ncbi:hypothetical protein ACOT81_36690 [Streptomyces sp. WI04-05B]|uniref:hypothetical protein n=1 Tax=Streptomyces TaxID=1883 RepID=UPI0039F5C5FD
MGTTEFVVAGLLPEIAGDLRVSVSHAGLLITAFAVGMIAGAPAMAVATLHLPRRSIDGTWRRGARISSLDISLPGLIPPLFTPGPACKARFRAAVPDSRPRIHTSYRRKHDHARSSHYQVAEGYRAMDERRAVKELLKP